MAKGKPFLTLTNLAIPDQRFKNYAHITFEMYPHSESSPESFVQRESLEIHILVKLNDPVQDEGDIASEAWRKLELSLGLLTGLAKNRGRIMRAG